MVSEQQSLASSQDSEQRPPSRPLKARKKDGKHVLSKHTSTLNEGTVPRHRSERIAAKGVSARSPEPASHPRVSPLTEEEEGLFAQLRKKRSDTSVVKVNGDDFPVGDDDLSDAVMDAYIGLINARERRYWKDVDEKKTSPAFGRRRTYCFDTSFVKNLTGSGPKAGYDFSAVSAVTTRSKVDILQLEDAMFPVKDAGGHWKLIVLNIAEKEVYHLDLAHRRDGERVVAALWQWTTDEIEKKHGKKKAEEFTERKKWNFRQFSYRVYRSRDGNAVKKRHEITKVHCLENRGNSGVYVLKLADCISLGTRIYFLSEQIGLVRTRMALELSAGRLDG